MQVGELSGFQAAGLRWGPEPGGGSGGKRG